MNHVAGPLHILLVEKEGRSWFNITCLQVYQFKIITWWRLSILESVLEFVLEFAMQYVLKYVPLEKRKRKSHGLLEFASSPPLGGRSDANHGRPCTLIHNQPCRTPCRLFIHKLFFGPLGLHLLVWSELGRSPPFRPMRTLTLPWSRAFNLVCEVALSPSLQLRQVQWALYTSLALHLKSLTSLFYFYFMRVGGSNGFFYSFFKQGLILPSHITPSVSPM